jgi:nicotinate-nucleotide pyrophosphorylase (carboxylating)
MLRPLDPSAYRDLVRRALEEDIGSGDLTTDATVPPRLRARGVFLAKAPCTVAGLDVAADAFKQLEPSIGVRYLKHDGDRCAAGDELAEIVGLARTLLAAERTALNFLQRLSGIATRARAFVDASGGRTVVLDTRKTTPTLRALEKYAVVVGGAANHRRGLFDAVLIKDNHVRLAGGVKAAVERVKRAHPHLVVEVEAQTLAEVDEALAAGAGIVLADNMNVESIRETVRRARGRAKVEVSGGVTLEDIGALADAGADYVSVGALTHSAPAVDISFEVEPIDEG